MSELDRLVAAVLEARKWRAICPATVRRIGEQELARGRTLKAAVKATKRRLHQITGAFDREPDDASLSALLERAATEDSLRHACRQALDAKSGSRERQDVLERFYTEIFALTGTPHSILDLACGHHPFSIPWMGLPRGARYVALDIDGRAIRLIDRLFRRLGTNARAVHADVLAHPPTAPADVAFLLKTLPSLERQEAGAGRRVLDALQARHVVVSYPVASLGGRRKGMREHYERAFLNTVADTPWTVERLEFPAELVFVVERSDARRST